MAIAQTIMCYCRADEMGHQHMTLDRDCPEQPAPGPVFSDPVNHPAHYTAGPATCPGCGRRIECIDVVKHLLFPVGAAIKYLWRLDRKGGPDQAIEDLRKAKQYIDFELERRGAS